MFRLDLRRFLARILRHQRTISTISASAASRRSTSSSVL
jgi:hypothetical protein